MRRYSVVLVTLLSAMVLTPVAEAQEGPGALSHFGLARKDCLGTARNTTSKVWYTVAGGVLSDVYAPTIDNTNVETLQFIVTDGRTFTDLQSRDTTYTVSADQTGMACTVRTKGHGYRLTTDYITDPARDSVLIRTRLDGPRDLKLYVRYDATINGNGGGGPQNGGADSATIDQGALISSDPNTVTNAPNRDYGVPLAGALKGPFREANSGYVGTDSDGLTQLDKNRKLTPNRTAANGNVVQTARIDGHDATLALSFGKTAGDAVRTANASLATPFQRSYDRYVQEWRDYDRKLRPTNDWLSPNVLKASEDKTFPGAVVASLASPWGQAVSAGDLPDGKPVYFGSYREIFARDLYESFSGLLAGGDRDTARATVRWLFSRQQQPDGRFPRNSMVNGKKAPDSGGDQLDESAYPILMALQAGMDREYTLYTTGIRKAADFVVAHGPSFGSERWEEQGGYSPSTIAAEIAGLTAASVIASRNGDPQRARVYQATADHFQRGIKGWTVTSDGYFIRLSKTGDPNAAIEYNLGNGSVTADQRSVVDGGFLELTRLGILPANDADVQRTLQRVDQVIKRDTPNGPGWYRYGTATPGSEDGYGDCYEPDPTNCAPSGKPWPIGNVGSGHLWPVLAGERGEQVLQTGDRRQAAELLRAMHAQASGVGLVPEQIWENPELPANPATGSIGFKPGESVGSASPLTWAQAQTVRLTQGIIAGRPVEQPAEVRSRYVDNGPPGTIPVTLDAPASVETPTVKVTGTAPAGVQIEIQATATDAGGATTVVSTTSTGTFSAELPTQLGTNVITAAATKGRATGYAQRTVASDFVSGTVILDLTDPDGDDNGPGTYGYPTAGDFHAGAFDIQRFQVIDSGDRYVLRTQLRNLSPTFGSSLGAQLLNIYARDPAVAKTSTQAPVPELHDRSVEPDDRGPGLRGTDLRRRGWRQPRYGDGPGE